MTSAVQLYQVTSASNVTCAEGVPVPCQEPEVLHDPGIQSGYLILAVIPVWILCGNLLVILAVGRQRSLRTLSNLVIASLAFTDSLLALLVVPLGVYQLVAGRWQLGLYVCLVWTGSDVVLSTTSIMHLCAIALYRYNGIASPLRVRSTHDMRNVAALVTPSWLIALALSIPFAVQGLTDSSNVLVSSPDTAGQFLQCGLFNRTFAAYSSLVSFFVPLTVMIFADIRSIQILRNNIRLGIPPSTSAANKSRRRRRGPNATTGECCVDDSSPPGCAPSCYAATSTADVSALPGSSSSTNCSTPRSGNVALELSLLKPFYVPQSRRRSRGTASDENQQEETVSLNSSSSRYLYRGRSKSKPVIYISMLTSGGCSMKVNSRERRAERTLVWVFVVFVVLWLPFFSVNLVYGLCHSCHIPGHVFAAFTWLGYLSSGVNPCIYTYLNKDFRNAFNRILTCKRVGQPQIRRQYS